MPIKEIIARGHDNGTHLHGYQFILLLVVDTAHRADLGTDATLPLLQLHAGVWIDGSFFRDGLGKGDVDGRGRAQKLVERIRAAFTRTFFRAQAAARARCPVHIGGLAADGDGKIAHIAAYRFHFGAGIQGNFLVLGNIHHFRAKYTGRAINGGKGLVELGHLAANTLLALHHDHIQTAICAVQRRLNAGHAPTNHQHLLDGGEAFGHQWPVAAQLFHGHEHQVSCLVGVVRLVFADPGDMLADIGHFKHVAVQACPFHCPAEGGFVHARRARGHHHPIQVVFMDGSDDAFLPWL